MEWQPIETAPKDGQIVMSYWNDTPVFVSYTANVPRKDYVTRGWGPFKREVYETVGTEGGWRVCGWSPRIGWALNGNCAPFQPTHWMPLPAPPYLVSVTGGGGSSGSPPRSGE